MNTKAKMNYLKAHGLGDVVAQALREVCESSGQVPVWEVPAQVSEVRSRLEQMSAMNLTDGFVKVLLGDLVRKGQAFSTYLSDGHQIYIPADWGQ